MEGLTSRKRQYDNGKILTNGIAVENSCVKMTEDKIFNDPVHGSITLNGCLLAIIDTPQFQRLRNIKQLGASYWVYPGACHNRFEHSIGTSYLCGKMIRHLKERHQDLITEEDILCIEIAGLCHDLGHGPFSHVFDTQYKKLVAPDSEWSHEKGSCDMFDHMFEQNKSVQDVFHEFKINESERKLVKDLILGKDPRKDEIDQKCDYEEKEMEKWFLFEIVSNKRNGIDCDKFDYLMRDSYYVGAKNNFDCMRYFQTTRIIPVDGQLQVCVRDKEYLNLYEMFHMRWSLHHRVYQHKTTKIVEAMLCEAMRNVDEVFGIFSSIKDMSSYTYLTDSIINEICRSKKKDKGIKEAKIIINRLHTRQLYKFCGQVNAMLNTDKNITSLEEILNKGELRIAEEIAGISHQLECDDIIVQVINISFGMKNCDPVNSVIFFNKEGQPKKIKKEHISDLLPQQFQEKYIRVYCRDAAKKSLVESSFQSWSSENGFGFPNLLDGDTSGYFTDAHKSPTDIKIKIYERRESLERSAKVRRNIFDKDQN